MNQRIHLTLPFYLVHAAVAKLTDHTKYTGAHKERFDESGEGKGLAGRDSTATGTGSGADAFHGGAVSDLSAITREGTRGGTSLSSATRAREAVPAIERIPATVHAAPAKAPVSARSPAATSERAPVSSRSPAASSDRAPGSARSPAATSARAPEERRASAGGGEAPSDLYAIFTSYCAFGGTSSGYVPEVRIMTSHSFTIDAISLRGMEIQLPTCSAFVTHDHSFAPPTNC